MCKNTKSNRSWRRDISKAFSAHASRIALLAVLALTVPVGIFSCLSYSIRDEPYRSWGSGDTLSTGQAGGSFTIEAIDMDLKSGILRTRSFTMRLDSMDNMSFNSVLIWSPKDYMYFVGHPLTWPNGTWNWAFPQRLAYWPLPTPPEKGAEPWPWPLTSAGEYPWDTYSLTFLFGFNRTMNWSGLRSDVSLPGAMSDQWKVSQTFEALGASPAARLGTGFIEELSRHHLYLSGFVDFYLLTITFVRQFEDVRRAVLAFWAPSLLLVGLLILAFGRSEALDLTEGLTLFVGIGLGTLPFIVGALQLLPPRLSAVELLLYCEVAVSIIFAAWMIKTKTS
jgi:hypothetical protein